MEQSFGQILKQKRESLGQSIRQVSVAIKMTPSMIQDIENENMINLPQAVFLRGLLKTYCKHLGLNEDEIIPLFDQATKYEKTGAKRSPIEDTPGAIKTPTYIWLSKVFIPLFIIIGLGLGGAGIIYITKKYDKEIRTVINPNIRAIHKAQDNTQTTENISGEATTLSNVSETATDLTTTPAADKITQVITLEPLAKTVVHVKIDDSDNQKIILRPDINKTFQAKNKIKLVIQDGGAVNIIHNNKDIGVPGVFGQEVEVTFPNK